MRGRKPTPTTLKRLRGNPGRRPIADDSGVTMSEKIPRPPARLTDDPATGFFPHREWFRMAPRLHAAGLLTTLDLRLFEGYCVQYARWCQAEDEIRRSGTVILSARHKQPMISPFVKVARDAFAAWNKALLEFGMTPSSRSRVSVTKPEKPDAFQLFLERGRLPTREELE